MKRPILEVVFAALYASPVALTVTEVAAITALPLASVRSALSALAARGRVISQGQRQGSLWTVRGQLELFPVAATVHRLPLATGRMHPVAGERHEGCAMYASCLDAFVRAHSGRRVAACGTGCFVSAGRTELSHAAVGRKAE